MKPPTPLPPLDLIEANFEYDPITGDLRRLQSGKAVRNNDRTSGCMKVRVGRKTTQVSRVAWYLFYREDPVGYYIEHIDGDPHNNCITNLRKVRCKPVKM